MALYSFCVRKRGTENYVPANKKHDLPFLDYMAMRFNNKEELMKFLGADLQKYDDIAIRYQANGEEIILPVYFDAKELDEISGLMVDLNQLEDCKTAYELLAVAYKNPGNVGIKKVPDVKTLDVLARAALKEWQSEKTVPSDIVGELVELIEAALDDLGESASKYVNKEAIRKKYLEVMKAAQSSKPKGITEKIAELDAIKIKLENVVCEEYGKRFGITGYRANHIEKKASEGYLRRRFELFKAEYKSSYLILRRSYSYLRDNGLLKVETPVTRTVPDLNMQEIYDRYVNKNDIPYVFSVETTEYENNLIQRCLGRGDDADNAYDELMQFPMERLIQLRPVIDHIREVRGQQRTIGVMPGTE